jgi:hypothetical protein
MENKQHSPEQMMGQEITQRENLWKIELNEMNEYWKYYTLKPVGYEKSSIRELFRRKGKI